MGLNPTKFEVCNWCLKYWEEYFLNCLRVFVVVYKYVIEICMKIISKYLGKVIWLCL